MKIVQKSQQVSFRERGSKFLGYLFPCQTLEEFEVELHQIKSEHPNATHHCYAYRIDPVALREFSSDDGEPSGTAGLPILNQLKSADLVNVGAVVVRYFGGTKLGKPGLIEAYGGTTILLTDQAVASPVIQVQEYQITYPYSEELLISKMTTDFGLIERKAEYTDLVTKTVACPLETASAFEKYHKSVKHRGITLEPLGKTIVAG